MVIQHNLNAIGALRHFGNNQNTLAKSLEKLSSGYQINSAADGAASLAISERMRNQITGIEQTEKNVKENINTVKLAEGTLGEIHSMVDRFKELASISANGTFTDVERADIQREVDQLAQEINRIAACNGLLGSGSFHSQDDFSGVQNELVMEYVDTSREEGIESGKIVVSLNPDKNTELNAEQLFSIEKFFQDFGNSGETGISFDFSGVFESVSRIDPEETLTTEIPTEITSKSESEGNSEGISKSISVNSSSNIAGNIVLPLDFSKPVFQGESRRPIFGNKEETESPVDISLQDMHEITNNISNTNLFTEEKEKNSSSLSITNSEPQVTGELNLQVGPTGDSYNMMTVPSFDVSMKGLGLENFNVSTQENAKNGLEMINNATKLVSSCRATYGGILNALDHRLNVLGITKENLSEAESRIRDTNFAEEMMEYTKMNVLVQASQAMVAQANQFPENVLMFIQ